jgi:DNA-directed RNA polymerase alpha subunit
MSHERAVLGAIEGLHLPARAWKALQREKITTLDRLKAVVDRLERLEAIGPKTARTIRAELRRLTFHEKLRHDSFRPAQH